MVVAWRHTIDYRYRFDISPRFDKLQVKTRKRIGGVPVTASPESFSKPRDFFLKSHRNVSCMSSDFDAIYFGLLDEIRKEIIEIITL